MKEVSKFLSLDFIYQYDLWACNRGLTPTFIFPSGEDFEVRLNWEQSHHSYLQKGDQKSKEDLKNVYKNNTSSAYLQKEDGTSIQSILEMKHIREKVGSLP